MSEETKESISKLDRELQRKILETLAKESPNGCISLMHLLVLPAKESDIFMVNLFYLEDHGLLESGYERNFAMDGTAHFHDVAGTKITANGLDFLEQDGGLSAVLGVVTVRLHDDTIKHLIGTKIMESSLEPDDKKKYLAQLRELPADATKHLVMRLLDRGVDAIPMGAIGSLIGSAAKAFVS